MFLRTWSNLPLLRRLITSISGSADLVNATWPNSFPKQLAAEYPYHHAIVHGHRAWNAPDSVNQPLAYVQDQNFDSGFGISVSSDASASNQLGHQDLSELYSRSKTPPPNDYTAAVIGRDGNAFNGSNAAFSLYAYENLEQIQGACVAKLLSVTNAFYWVVANATNSNTSTFDNSTFASANSSE